MNFRSATWKGRLLASNQSLQTQKMYSRNWMLRSKLLLTTTELEVLRARLQLVKARQKKGKRSTKTSMLRTTELKNLRKNCYRSVNKVFRLKRKLAHLNI